MANLTQHIRATPQIVVAAVNGPAYGGGLSLSLACDLRVAARSATFCSAFIKTGLTGTDIGVTYLLPRLIGASRAFDLIVTGRTVDADAAERLGIVSQVFDDDGFLDAALGVADGIAAYTGIGLRMTKEVMWANLDTPNMAACIALENRNQEIAGRSPEVQEYMRAYSGRVTGEPRLAGSLLDQLDQVAVGIAHQRDLHAHLLDRRTAPVTDSPPCAVARS